MRFAATLTSLQTGPPPAAAFDVPAGYTRLARKEAHKLEKSMKKRVLLANMTI